VTTISIVLQAPSGTVFAGQPVSFSVATIGSSVPTYQWQASTDDGGTWTNLTDGNEVNGTETVTLGISATTAAMNGEEFRAVATNDSGSVTSTPLTLSVTPLSANDVLAYDFGILTGTAGISGNGLAVDSAGNVYATYDQTVLKITPPGGLMTLAGTAGQSGSADGTGSAAQFFNPYGLAVDSAGNVYVADSANETIRKITPAGVVTTLAGTAGQSGSADGTGSAARFDGPFGVAVDSANNVYVADSFNYTIRKITPAGVVTTLAGTASQSGSADGTGSAARFGEHVGVAVDGAGNVYVADTGNATIRRVTPAGVVTTLAGAAGQFGSADGTGAAAQFFAPEGIAVDSAGNAYVVDNDTIRKITPAGVVTTLAGRAGQSGGANGIGSTALFEEPVAMALDGAGDLYVTDVIEIHKGIPTPVVPTSSFESVTVVAAAPSQVIPGGTPVILSLSPANGYTYQWICNGVPIPGASAGTYTPGQINGSNTGVIGTTDAGVYTVQVTDPSGNVGYIALGTLSVTENAWLINLSARASVGTGGNVLIAGFVSTGPGDKAVMVRGDGPSLGLSPFNVSGVLAKPQLDLYSGQTDLQTVTGWAPNLAPLFGDVGAFSWAAASADTAFLHTFAPGGYTTIVSGVGSTIGVALIELYDADAASNKELGTTLAGPPTNRLENISARADVLTGGNVMVGGFVFAGTTSKTFLIRGGGPFLALSPFNVTGALPSTTITLYDSNQKAIATNQGWSNPITVGTSPLVTGPATQVGLEQATRANFSAVGASGSWNPGSGDSAMIITLPPGAYTVIESGVNGATGIGLVEIYEAN
jgi:hypothetical protein